VTAEGLGDLSGEVWERWLRAEPVVSTIGSLDDLHAPRGLATRRAAGRVAALAARNGGDDEPAEIVVDHHPVVECASAGSQRGGITVGRREGCIRVN
jgi:hypothetical protein